LRGKLAPECFAACADALVVLAWADSCERRANLVLVLSLYECLPLESRHRLFPNPCAYPQKKATVLCSERIASARSRIIELASPATPAMMRIAAKSIMFVSLAPYIHEHTPVA
jgi:hypothetical protein